MRTWGRSHTALSLALVVVAGCTVGEEVGPPRTADELASERSASVEMGSVVVSASRADVDAPIAAVVADRETDDPLLLLDWDVAQGALSWRLPGEELSRPIEDARAELEPSLGQAIAIAHEQWQRLSGEGEDESYWGCDGSIGNCSNACPYVVGIYVCRQEIQCTTFIPCTPDGCGDEEQRCAPEIVCEWQLAPVWECCEWGCLA